MMEQSCNNCPVFHHVGKLLGQIFGRGQNFTLMVPALTSVCACVCKMPVKFPYPRDIAPVSHLAFTSWENRSLERTKPIASSVPTTKIPHSHSLLGQT